ALRAPYDLAFFVLGQSLSLNAYSSKGNAQHLYRFLQKAQFLLDLDAHSVRAKRLGRPNRALRRIRLGCSQTFRVNSPDRFDFLLSGCGVILPAHAPIRRYPALVHAIQKKESRAPKQYGA